MESFVDPRGSFARVNKPIARTTANALDLKELHQLCREGRLYDVEGWIQAGLPLQRAQGDMPRPGRTTSALGIALEAGNHALTLLLLCNGYDPNQEPNCPIDIALRTRRFDLLDLLLEWGSDPRGVCLDDLFGTYRSELFERFRVLGVDLTTDHALAVALAYHTSNRPLFGFAKRHREADVKIQTELNIALVHHAGAGNEKGVQLCLWAGADPHAEAPSLRSMPTVEEDTAEDGEERFIGFSAVHEACLSGHVEILKRLCPDPSRDDFDWLYGVARNGAIIDVLACSKLPADVGAVVHSHLRWITPGFRDWESVYVLRRLFEIGVRWDRSSAETIAAVRWSLLKVPDQTFIEVVKLLATGDHSAPEILRELARTPSFQKRLKEVGFFPQSGNEPDRQAWMRPTRGREVLKKLGVELAKPKGTDARPRLPRCVTIGTSHPNGREVRFDRSGLFERVWSLPVATLAAEWGLSGPGLKKACRKLQIPVPPRGYWARLNAGQRVRRPPLPQLPSGQVEEIVILAQG